MKVALKNVRPNPFRDMDAYPIHPQKIENLKRSINSTEFWDNVVARESDTEPGCIEIAYGHHRLTALRELYDGGQEFNWIVRELDDRDMIKIMAHENLKEWGHDSSIERETVRAVVQAYGADKIGLTVPQGAGIREDQLRYAPSFCFGINELHRAASHSVAARRPYTADTIVNFLGGTMSINTVKYTLRALCLIEQGHITEEEMKGLASSKARVVIDETARSVAAAERIKESAAVEANSAATPILAEKIKKEAKKKAKSVVRKTAKKTAKTLQDGGSVQDAKSAATEARVPASNRDEQPEINTGAKRVAKQIRNAFHEDQTLGKKINELIKYREYLEPKNVNELDSALKTAGEWIEGYRARLK